MTETDDHVWYVSYGSNLSPRRFLTYLTGGAVPRSGHAERGSSDPAPPVDVRPVVLPHVMYFGRSGGARWGGGGVAFVDPERGDEEAFGLAYRVTVEQYLDVLCQENGWSEPPDPVVAIPSLQEGPRTLPPSGGAMSWYRTVVGLAPIDGLRAVTFTHPEVELAHEPASPAYLQVIAEGLGSQHGLRPAGIAEYLAARPGVGWGFEQLHQLLVAGAR